MGRRTSLTVKLILPTLTTWPLDIDSDFMKRLAFLIDEAWTGEYQCTCAYAKMSVLPILAGTNHTYLTTRWTSSVPGWSGETLVHESCVSLSGDSFLLVGLWTFSGLAMCWYITNFDGLYANQQNHMYTHSRSCNDTHVHNFSPYPPLAQQQIQYFERSKTFQRIIVITIIFAGVVVVILIVNKFNVSAQVNSSGNNHVRRGYPRVKHRAILFILNHTPLDPGCWNCI